MPITLDFDKVRALAKKGHAVCHGEGIAGRRLGDGLIVLCKCVLRNLVKQGIHLDDRPAVQKALGPEEKKEVSQPQGQTTA